MHTILQDLRFALRQLRRAPGFALTAVLTLALTVAANVIIFGIVDALVLHPLPVAQPRQFFQIEQHGIVLSYPNYRDLRDRNRTFSAVAVARLARIGMGAEGAAQPVWGYEASGNYFETLGVRPALGRFYGPADDVAINGSAAAVLSYACWQARFHGDPQIVGKKIRLNKLVFTVTGVAPKHFVGTERFFSPEVWVPFLDGPEIEGMNDLDARSSQGSWVFGRLKSGVTPAQAEADLQRIAAQLARDYPTEDQGIAFQLTRPGLLGDTFGKPVRGFLSGVMALALLVLLAACANLGSLFSSRTADRAKELSIRLAIGSSRLRILRQLLAEALLISALGGTAAALLSGAMLQGLTRWRPPTGEIPVQFLVTPGPAVYLFAAVLALLDGMLFALVPARQIWRTDPNLVLKQSAANTGLGHRSILRSALLVVQIALCCLLVTSSFVAVRGLGRTYSLPLGFDPQGVTVAGLDVHLAGYSGEQPVMVMQQRLLAAVQAIPGVTAAAYASNTPLSLDQSASAVYRPGTTAFDEAHVAAVVSRYAVSPTYFATTGTKLLAGRTFTEHDNQPAPRVAIVNQTFAKAIFGTVDAVGRRFPTAPGKDTEVVGVVEDGKYRTLNEAPEAAIFWPILQRPDNVTLLLVRSDRPSAEISIAMRRAIAGVDSSLPIFRVESWSKALELVTFPARAATVALGVLGGLALLLATTGIFGLASYTVSRRMREFGIRVALGARKTQVLRAALGQVFLLLGTGSAVGLMLGFGAGRLLSAIVFQATASDPLVLAAVTATMACLGLLAAALPARRALNTEPATLLREE